MTRGRLGELVWRQHAGGMLLGAMAAGLFMSYLIGALAPQFRDELGLDRVTLGLLSSSFYIVAASLSSASPLLVRRIGPANSLALLFVASGTGCVLVSAATSPAWLVVACVVSGLAAAAGNPATNEFLAAMKPPFAILVGAKQSGVQFAALIVGVAVVPLAGVLGWRTAVLLCGVVFYLLAVVVLLTLRSPRPPGTREKGGRGGSHWALLTYGFLMGGGISTVNTYLPLFAFERLEFTAPVAGIAVGVFGFGGIVARIGWSVVAERLGAGSMNRLLGGQAVFAALSALMLVAAFWWGDALLWAAALLMGLSAAAWSSLVFLFVILAGKNVGGISGQVQSAFYFGLMSTPLLFGFIVDSTGSYEAGWIGTTAVFLVAALVSTRIPKAVK